MNAFAKHGIKHLSPSSLNLWSSAPGIWAVRYLGGAKDETGPSAARGKAIEDALLHILHGRQNPVEIAENAFLQNTQGEINEDIDAERGMLAGMVNQCLLWKPPGQIVGSQMKVEHFLDGIPVPVIGYLDFAFDETDVDLKTTKACPSKPKPDHVRQVALYRAARGKRGKLLYVTEKRHAEFEVDDAMRDEALHIMGHTAASLENFLSRFDCAEDAIRCLPMDRDNFRWSIAAEQRVKQLLEAF